MHWSVFVRRPHGGCTPGWERDGVGRGEGQGGSMILVVVLISGELGFPSGRSSSNKSSADRPLLSTHLGAFHRRRRRTAARSHHLLSELIIGPRAEVCRTQFADQFMTSSTS